MSYHIHTSRGIILKRFAEDYSASFLIFTKDFGLIRAKAQGVRKISSKLKYALQEYFVSNVSFLRGKGGFRIVGAEFIESFYEKDLDQVLSKKIALIFKTILRFVSYEDINEDLYVCLETGLTSLKNSKKEEVDFIELFLLLNIMYVLGYISKDEISIDFSKDFVFDRDKLSFVKDNRDKITTIINKAFQSSHL